MILVPVKSEVLDNSGAAIAGGAFHKVYVAPAPCSVAVLAPTQGGSPHRHNLEGGEKISGGEMSSTELTRAIADGRLVAA